MVDPSPQTGAVRVEPNGRAAPHVAPEGPSQSSDELYRARWQARQDDRLATRRRVLRWVIRAGTAAFSLALLLPALALRSLSRPTQEVAAGDLLVYATGDQSGLPVDVATLATGQSVQAFPEGKSEDPNNLIELVRLGEDLPSGLVAYSAICTHLGCTVLPNLTEDGYILCPCHASFFDPARGAEVLNGPANRALPSLPIEVSGDGQLLAAGGFSGPVGPQ